MRKLMWFTTGFGAACIFCAYTWTCEGLILPACLFAAVSVASLFGSKRLDFLKILGTVCVGIGLGLGWFQIYSNFYLSEAAKLDGELAQTSVRCTDYSYQTDYGTAVEGFVYLNGKPFRGKFYVNGDVLMEPGDVLTGCFEFRVTTEDGAKGATYHQGKAIFLLGFQEEDAQLLKVDKRPFWAYPALLRYRLTEIIDACFPADCAGFAKALLLGDRTDISYELNTAFKISGIMQIIAVSGLHVTILFTLINTLVLKRRGLLALIGIPVLLLFAAVAGFTPSVIRACIMQCLMIGAMLFNKEYDGPTELSFASLVMLLGNPLVITSISFQLSVGCMMGILLFQKPIYDWLSGIVRTKKGSVSYRIWNAITTSASMTLSAISLTMPLSAYYFGAVSIVGILSNLLILWAVTLVFCGITLVCVTGLVLPTVATAAAWVIAWLIRYIIFTAQILSAIPSAAVYTRSIYIVAWIVFCYVLLSAFLVFKKQRPSLLIAGILLSLLVCVGASWLEPRLDECRMTVLNVGQGQCIILQSDNRTYLVDCGGRYDEDAADLAAETLISQGIYKIDGLILTHFDRDHAGGAIYFLSRIPTARIYVPAPKEQSVIQNSIYDLESVQIKTISNNLYLSYGETVISIYPSDIPDSKNEGSLAVLFQRENCDILITGDRSEFGERILMKTAQIPQLDVLVAGHHGSRHSTCEELLAVTKPAIVVISVGDNPYGHPSQELLDRLERYGCTVYRTDLHGNIIFRR